jgi:hypothetical protein
MRSKSGYSIVLVSSLGLILVMAALAVTAGLIPVYKNIGAQNMVTQAQEAADAGVQYAVNQLNESADPSKLTNLQLPSAYTSATVQIKIELPGTNPFDPDSATKAFASNQKLNIDTRKITSSAVVGLNKATVIAFVQSTPAIPLNPVIKNQTQVSSKSFFNNALFGASSMSINASNGTLNVLSQNGTRQASVSSNKSVSFSGSTVVDGNVVANNIDSKSTSISGSSSNKINGNLVFNGNMPKNGLNPAFIQDSFINRVTYGTSNLNVLGDGQVGRTVGTITSQLTQTAFAPSESPALNQVSYLGDINIKAGETVQIAPGNYLASSINIEKGGQLQVTGDTQNFDGVVLNVEGESGSPVVNINGKVSNSLGAQNFQIFYSGTSSVSLNTVGDFVGLIYAPNAQVTLSMAGQKFTGAIASDKVNVTGNGSIYFDPASVGMKSGSGPSSDPKNNTTNNLFYTKPQSSNMNYYRILSWYEY